ncbi:hypothetical protein BT63DRAFT_169907 [Microthyrium microscopicum]|uniref:Amino acid transporter transmembrane domain-containing protein n=1 Tax=Microthyrium microscopicum TaxID=703497 RepID=A0A6A6UQ43_9PEZI|nr:hypothetical protein BT63DRAFT_169907 [Microthyrium microscopicum]
MANYATVSQADPDVGGGSPTPRMRRPRRKIKDGNFTGTASFSSSVINLVNTIVGAGVLAMPRAMSQMGMLLGTIFIVWSGITAGFGLYLQTKCAMYLERGHSSFFALSQLTYPNLAIIFDAAIAVKCFGVGVSYLIIIGDLMPGVVLGFNAAAGDVGYLVDRHFWITGFMLVVIPLSFLRRLDSLKYTSIIALVAIGYLIILVLAHFIKGDTIPDRGEVNFVRWAGPLNTLASLPVIVFAYTCHQNMFSILNEIKNNSHFRTTGVVIASIGTACSVYVLVAITGYLSYGNNVQGNIVSMYPPTIASTIGRAAIVVLVMFSYPLQVHPCRASVDAVLKWRPASRRTPPPPPSSAPSTTRSGSPSRAPDSSQHPGKGEMSDTRFAALTGAIIIASYLVAMIVSSLETVLAYVGSTGSTSISFILPGLFYYKISSPDSPAHQKLMKDNDWDEDDDYYSDHDDEDADAEGNPLLTSSIASLRSLQRGTNRVLRRFKPRDLLRKLSLTLAIYGVVVMVVCLGTNAFLHSTKH